jgi:hypothetical protein
MHIITLPWKNKVDTETVHNCSTPNVNLTTDDDTKQATKDPRQKKRMHERHRKITTVLLWTMDQETTEQRNTTVRVLHEKAQDTSP